MKLKSIVVAAIIVVSFLLGGTVAQAQGIYSNRSSDTEKVSAESTRTGGLFRDNGEEEGGWGAGGGEPTQPGLEPEEHTDPIGGGLLILSLLSGVYALVRRKSRDRA